MTQLITNDNKDEEIRAYHRKRLYELSLKSIRDPQLETLNGEQLQWVNKKMRDSASWRSIK